MPHHTPLPGHSRYLRAGVRGLALLLAIGLAACADAPARGPGSAPLSDAERAALGADLVVVVETDGARRTVRIDTRTGDTTGLGSGRHSEVPLAVSPDGRAFVLGRVVPGPDRDLEQLWLYEGASGRALTPPTVRARHPSWSPDGRWLVFESDLRSPSDLYRAERADRLDPDRPDPERALVRLTDDPEGNYEPTVAADGASVVFVSSRDMNAEAYRVRPDGRDPVRLPGSPRDEWHVRPSPDGRSVAMLTTERGRDEIVIARADGVDRRRPGASRPGSSRPGADGHRDDLLEAEPTWSPDGRRLAYTTLARSGARRLWVVDLETGTHTALTDTLGRAREPAWSPDGRHLAVVSDRDGHDAVFVLRADGTGLTRVSPPGAAASMPLWVPHDDQPLP